jgi:hypothetical protein
MYLPEQSNGVCAIWTKRRDFEHSQESQEEPAEDGGAEPCQRGDLGNRSGLFWNQALAVFVSL